MSILEPSAASCSSSVTLLPSSVGYSEDVLPFTQKSPLLLIFLTASFRRTSHNAEESHGMHTTPLPFRVDGTPRNEVMKLLASSYGSWCCSYLINSAGSNQLNCVSVWDSSSVSCEGKYKVPPLVPFHYCYWVQFRVVPCWKCWLVVAIMPLGLLWKSDQSVPSHMKPTVTIRIINKSACVKGA